MHEILVPFRTNDIVRVGREIEPGHELMTLLRPYQGKIGMFDARPEDWVAKDAWGNERLVFWYGPTSGWLMYE